MNKGKNIDWGFDGARYFLFLDKDGKIASEFHCTIYHQGTVYCSDATFKDVAIKEIGEERLKRYLRGE